MPRRLSCLVLLWAAAAAGERPAYTPGAAPALPIESHKFVLRDEARGKDLRVRATFPAKGGPYPVLVFCHGLYGSRDGYQPLVTAWAAAGYVCLQADHEDSRALGFKPQAQALRAWSSRPRDVRFLIDALATLPEKVAGLRGKIDAKRVGVGGHSFGAHTSMLIGGTKLFAGARAVGFRDPRVKAVLLLSAQGKGRSLREESWKTMTLPALVLTGSRDTSPINDTTPEQRTHPYKYAPAGDKYLVWIEGAHHGFGGISGVGWRGAGPKNDDHVAAVRLAGLAFLDAYVKGDDHARAWLQAGALKKATKAELRLEHK